MLLVSRSGTQETQYSWQQGYGPQILMTLETHPLIVTMSQASFYSYMDNKHGQTRYEQLQILMTRETRPDCHNVTCFLSWTAVGKQMHSSQGCIEVCGRLLSKMSFIQDRSRCNGLFSKCWLLLNHPDPVFLFTQNCRTLIPKPTSKYFYTDTG